MFRNNFKTAWRSLITAKSFSIINMAGLTIGMAGAVLILLWLQHEISFDRFHANKDNLYEAYALTSNTDGHPRAVNNTSQPLGPALQKGYPEVVAATRCSNVTGFLLTANNKSIVDINGCVVDPSFLQMFSFPLQQGSQQQQLQNVYSITITEKLAKILFGKENAVGKIIRIDSVDNFTVTGVLKDLPSNTRFDFEYLLPWAYFDKLGHGFATETENWLSNNTSNFVLLKPNTNIEAFNEKIKNITRQHTGRNDVWTNFLFPLSQWHLYADFENGKPVGGRIQTVRVFGMIALFILLIACINFMNLTTARAEKRAKEIGIRKVAGASKTSLVGQFIAEAFLMAAMAGAIALLILQLALPSFNNLINTQLAIPYGNIYFWLCALGFILLTALLAGSYPAFYLSSFTPVSIFKKQFKKTNAVISPRKFLVVTQFSFAIVLIISTMVIRNQVIYAENRDKGYANNGVIQVNFVGDIDKNYALIKQELIGKGIASGVMKNMTGLTNGGDHTWGLRWPGENPEDTNTTITLYSADAGLLSTTGMHLVEGRDIDINKYPTDSFSVILNETAVKLMDFRNPIGQIISDPYNGINLHVVGVVKDFITGSPYAPIPPVVIEGPGSWFTTMHIKLNPAHNTADNLAMAERVFKTYNPAYPFDFQFIDQQYAGHFENEQRAKTLAGLFASLAIFISCLGLFGLSVHIAEARVKEIGVRKVLGASVGNITKLLTTDFVKLVIIAIVIASPLAWYAMNQWLQGYQYRIQIHAGVFIEAGAIAILIALATVSFQAIKAALENPVNSLRAE